MLSFYRGITMGHLIPCAHKLFANKHPKKYIRGSASTSHVGTCIIKLEYKHDRTITSLNEKDQAPQPIALLLLL